MTTTAAPLGEETPARYLTYAILAVKRAAPPQRLSALSKAAFLAGQLTAAGELTEDIALVALRGVAWRLGIPEDEALRIAQASLTSGKAHPFLEAAAVPFRKAAERPCLVRGDEAELADLLLDDLRFFHAGMEWVDYHLRRDWIIADEGAIWAYRPSRGIWERIPPELLTRIVKGFAGCWIFVRVKPPKGGGGEPEEIYKPLLVGSRHTAGAAKLAQAEVTRAGFFAGARQGIPFANGLLTVEEGKLVLRPHSPDHRARHALDVDWDPEATAPRWQAFLEEMLDPESAAVFREFVGLCLLGLATRFQLCLLLFGPGGNGKSTAIDIVASLVPPAALASVSPQKWGEDYHRAELVGKLLNVVSELPASEVVSTEAFKSIITGDAIGARRPAEPAFSFRPIAGNIFAANEFPATADFSLGFWRRLLILPFLRAVAEEKKNTELAREIAREERQGIYTWALTGALTALARGRLVEPEASKRLKGRWRIESDPVALWTEQFVEQNTSSAAMLSEILYEKFLEWARANGHRPMSSLKFQRRLRPLGWGEGPRFDDKRTWAPPAKPPGENPLLLEEEIPRPAWDHPEPPGGEKAARDIFDELSKKGYTLRTGSGGVIVVSRPRTLAPLPEFYRGFLADHHAAVKALLASLRS
jgi:P4 family phage/plasmid primase-like protien